MFAFKNTLIFCSLPRRAAPALQNRTASTWGPGLAFPNANRMKGPWSKLHPAAAPRCHIGAPHPSPPSSESPWVQRERHQSPDFFDFPSLFFFPLLPQRSSAPRYCLHRSRNENPRELLLSLGNSWQGSQQLRRCRSIAAPCLATGGTVSRLHPGCPHHPFHYLLTRNRHLFPQGLVPRECYKLNCLMGTADLSVFPLLIRAWLRACQAEEVILK